MDTRLDNEYRRALSHGRPKHGRCDDFSLKHPKMQLSQRAKIFSPFAALKGFEEAIDEKVQVYVEKRELSEEDQDRLNLALTRLQALLKSGPVRATVRFYVPCPDEHHEAYGRRGSYETLRGPAGRLDPVVKKTLRIGDREIALADLAGLWIEEADREEN